MKICLALPCDLSYPGGIQDHVTHLSTQLLAMGHTVRVLAPVSGSTHGIIPAETIISMGSTIPIAINGGTSRVSFNPFLGKRIRKVLSTEQFDVIHVHDPLIPGLSLEILKANPRALLVATHHNASDATNFSLPKLLYTVSSPFLQPLFKRLDGNIAVSTVARDFISQYFPADYRIIPNGIDLEEFGPKVSPISHLMDGKQNILFVGRFDKRKGAIYLLRAIPAIRKRHPNTRFIIAGDGASRYTFEQYVKKQGLHDVIFPGYVYGKTKSQYFASAHIFCAPGIGNESLPVILLEAMASKLPIVASNIKGYRTILEDGVTALLTPPRHVEDLSAAICRMVEDKSLRQRLIQAEQIKIRSYAWPLIARQVMNYYHELQKQTNKKFS